jgi:rhodanese-related sulfurtransferase
MGWVLAGLELEKRPGRTQASTSEASRKHGLALARQIMSEENISGISAKDVFAANLVDPFTYLIDVRSEDEYGFGHIPGSVNVPGGQAVQRADDFVAVRNARIVFVSEQSARAVMAAYWYRQMGFPNVCVLQDGLRAWAEIGGKIETGSLAIQALGVESAKQAARWIDAKQLDQKVRAASALVLDVGTSLEFETAHVPSAQWISRGWLDLELPELFPDRTQSIVMTCPDGQSSTFAAQTLNDLGYADVAVLRGGVRAWSTAGLQTENGLDACLMAPNDVVLSPSIRGTKEDMQRYLDWETKLPR